MLPQVPSRCSLCGRNDTELLASRVSATRQRHCSVDADDQRGLQSLESESVAAKEVDLRGSSPELEESTKSHTPETKHTQESQEGRHAQDATEDKHAWEDRHVEGEKERVSRRRKSVKTNTTKLRTRSQSIRRQRMSSALLLRDGGDVVDRIMTRRLLTLIESGKRSSRGRASEREMETPKSHSSHGISHSHTDTGVVAADPLNLTEKLGSTRQPSHSGSHSGSHSFVSHISMAGQLGSLKNTSKHH